MDSNMKLPIALVVAMGAQLAGAFAEIEELWEETESLTLTIGKITALQQRLALLENTMKFMNRDHMDMLDPRD